MSQVIGVLAIQGDFDKHIQAIKKLDKPQTQTKEIRTIEDLNQVDRLIIPGGESTTVGLLLQRFGLGHEIQCRAAHGMSVWGTCMGMILMANHVEGRDQFTLNLLDITVKRNAFGAQIHSFEDSLEFKGLDHLVTGVFIRAPIVTKTGPEVEVLATYQERTVAVRQGNCLGTSFHPELTDDLSLHQWFLEI